MNAKKLDGSLVVIEFELQSHYYVYFSANYPRERYKLPYSPSIDLVVSLFLFYKGGFCIR